MKSVAYVVAVMAILAARSASGQTQGTHLADLVPHLILDGITLPGAADPGSPHAGHFTLGNPTFGGSQGASIPDNPSRAAVATFGDRLRNQFANFPLGSSTGGFTYTYDTSTGSYSRSSNSFGPAFSERAATIGRRKLGLGFNYQHTGFDTFGGKNLDDGTITFYLPHTDCCNAAAPPPSPEVPGLEGDIVQASLWLKATSDTFALLANYGVTDRWDVGVVIPVARVDLDARVRANIIRLSTFATPLVHTFAQDQDLPVKTFSESGTATGLGDIVARTKYTFVRAGHSGLAAAVDLRLPTGNEDDLLGIGAAQAKVYLIVASATDRLSPHVNVGYTVSGQGKRDSAFVLDPLGVSDEFNYTGGLEVVAHPRLTVLADVIGRTLIDAGNLEEQGRTFQYRVGAGAAAAAPLVSSTINPLTGDPYRQLALAKGHLQLLLGSAGFKFNAATNLLVSGNVLFPLNNSGLRDRLTFALGIDYAF